MTITNKVGATTFSMPSDREIAMTRTVDAPRQRVFEAWTEPNHLPNLDEHLASTA